MITKATKWGNGLGIRLKKELARSLGIVPGTPIELIKSGNKIILQPLAPDKMTIDWLCADMVDEEDIMEGWNDVAAEGKEVFWKDE